AGRALERDDARDRAWLPADDSLGSIPVENSVVAIFGAGYAGLVTGACFASLGHAVRIRDVSAEKIDALTAGQIPHFEPGLAELVERNRERLTFTLNAAEALDGC